MGGVYLTWCAFVDGEGGSAVAIYHMSARFFKDNTTLGITKFDPCLLEGEIVLYKLAGDRLDGANRGNQQ
jgi:hypothetical protein